MSGSSPEPSEPRLPALLTSSLPPASPSQRRAMRAVVDGQHDRIADRLDWVVDKLFELGNGVLVEEYSKDGERIVYRTPPNRMALQYLFDRVAGKPAQKVKHGMDEETVDSIEGWLEKRQKELGHTSSAAPVDASQPQSQSLSQPSSDIVEGEFRPYEEGEEPTEPQPPEDSGDLAPGGAGGGAPAVSTTSPLPLKLPSDASLERLAREFEEQIESARRSLKL